MGEIADMMLEGLLDEETGEYIGEENLERYGDEAPGFPVSYAREARERGGNCESHEKVACPHCGKRVADIGLRQHIQAKHQGSAL